MKRTLFALLAAACLGAALAGCADSYGGSPAGAEAGTNKEYTKEDAAAAVPKRGGSETE
jgi:hypothetical protein